MTNIKLTMKNLCGSDFCMYLCMFSGWLYNLECKLYDVKILSDLHSYIASTGQ